MARPHRFGSTHTREKLDSLEKYLRAFSTALKNQGFRLIFFDAFAGTGDVQIGEDSTLLDGVDDYSPFIQGSTQRALQLGTAFDEYVFVEQQRAKVKELEALKAAHTEIADRISVRHSDANAALLEFCAKTDWKKSRAVVFLDPYGNQVKWKTIEAIAKTEGIDLWYLFPAGLGVHRQIGRDAKVHESHETSLDELLGTKDWRGTFIEEQEAQDLFGSRTERSKVATPESITRFMIQRMRTIFRGGVLDGWLPLSSRSIHMYSLVFAWANPSEKAKLAGKLAAAVLRSKRRGRVK